jgi:hypothetical protein
MEKRGYVLTLIIVLLAAVLAGNFDSETSPTGNYIPLACIPFDNWMFQQGYCQGKYDYCVENFPKQLQQCEKDYNLCKSLIPPACAGLGQRIYKVSKENEGGLFQK